MAYTSVSESDVNFIVEATILRQQPYNGKPDKRKSDSKATLNVKIDNTRL